MQIRILALSFFTSVSIATYESSYAGSPDEKSLPPIKPSKQICNNSYDNDCSNQTTQLNTTPDYGGDDKDTFDLPTTGYVPKEKSYYSTKDSPQYNPHNKKRPYEAIDDNNNQYDGDNNISYPQGNGYSGKPSGYLPPKYSPSPSDYKIDVYQGDKCLGKLSFDKDGMFIGDTHVIFRNEKNGLGKVKTVAWCPSGGSYGPGKAIFINKFQLGLQSPSSQWPSSYLKPTGKYISVYQNNKRRPCYACNNSRLYTTKSSGQNCAPVKFCIHKG